MEPLQIEMPDIGKLRKLRIWHEKRNPFSGWHLARVRNFALSDLSVSAVKSVALSPFEHFKESLLQCRWFHRQMQRLHSWNNCIIFREAA